MGAFTPDRLEVLQLLSTQAAISIDNARLYADLAQSEEKYRTLFEDSKDAIFITTPAGKLMDANPTLLSLFGYSRDEAMQMNVTELYMNPADRLKFRQAIEQAGEVRDFDLKFYKKNGTEMDCLLTAMVRRDHKGHIMAYQGLIRDITEQKQNERLRAENLRLQTELQVAQRLQQMALPTQEELKAVESLEIAGYMEPADEVGGDYYDVLQREGKIKICIGDVTGHGLESGVMMLMTQTALRTLVQSGETDPVRFLNILNRTIYENVRRMKTDRNLTLSLLDYGAGEVRLSGQHETMIVIRRNGRVELVDTMDLGFPIGLEADITEFIDQTRVRLQSGDGMVLYTDGITEAEDFAGAHYGLERLCEVVRQNWDQSAESIKEAVVADVHGFIGQQRIFDDITLLVLKQK
jgi:phosphoserine phosphatase RsbU/P